MAGFNIVGTGDVNSQKSNVAETRKKHRWIFTKLGDVLQQGELVYLQKAARPNFKLEEQWMHHDQEKASFAGKQGWEPISFSWYDVQQNPDVSARLWIWLQSVVPTLGDRNAVTCVAAPSKYKKIAVLEMTGNCDTGRGEEAWTFYGLWPKEVNWQELDYEANEILRIDVTANYDRAYRGK